VYSCTFLILDAQILDFKQAVHGIKKTYFPLSRAFLKNLNFFLSNAECSVRSNFFRSIRQGGEVVPSKQRYNQEGFCQAVHQFKAYVCPSVNIMQF
jgi:hypothetical protein